MSYDERSEFQGLVTAIAETLAPRGALRLADNVVIRRLGAIEPRQGFLPKEIGFSKTFHDFIDAVPFEDGVVYRSDESWLSYTGGQMLVSPPLLFGYNVEPLRPDVFQTAKLRGSLYVPNRFGVAKLPKRVGSESFTTAGVHFSRVIPNLSPQRTGTGTLLPTGTRVAYRAVYVAKDVNGLITTSAPTGASTITNNGTPSDVSWSLSTRAMGELDQVEIYRTRIFPSTVATDEEMQLVATLAKEDFLEPAPGFFSVDFHDDVPDAQRGKTLYTSPSQEGIENQNLCPPACAVVESYRGCLFFGNTVGPRRMVLSYNYDPNLGNVEEGLGRRTVSAVVTAGSNVITGVSNMTGIRLGQQVQGGFQEFAYITNIAGNTVTVSQAALSSGTVVNFLDALLITYGGLTEAITMDTTGEFLQNRVSSALSGRVAATRITPPLPGYQATIVLESISHESEVTQVPGIPGTAYFDVMAAHGYEFSPPLPVYGETPKAPDQDVYPNGLAWSKVDEPEHVPPINFVLVSDRTYAILGLCATRDSLFIFKEDGIWRLSGAGGQWRIDPFDLTTFCVLPSSIKRLDNRIYFLSNKGIVAMDETGVQVISDPIRDQVARIVDAVLDFKSANGYYGLAGIEGTAAYVDDVNREYALLKGTVVTDMGGDVLVYNALSGAWTTFSYEVITPWALAQDELGRPLLLGDGIVNVSNEENVMLGGEPLPNRSDQIKAVTISNVTYHDAAHLYAQVSLGTTFHVDDILHTDIWAYPIVGAVTSHTAIVALTDNLLPALGPGKLYRAIPCSVRPAGFPAPKALEKTWTRTIAAFARFRGANTGSVLFSSSGIALVEAEQLTAASLAQISFARVNGVSGHPEGILAKLPVTAAHQRSWMLRTLVSWRIAFGFVSLEAIGAEARDNVPGRSLQASTGTT